MKAPQWLRSWVSPDPPAPQVISAALSEANRRADEARDRAEDRALIRRISDENALLREQSNDVYRRNAEIVAEVIEARSMAGTGPWLRSRESLRQADGIVNRVAAGLPLRENATPAATVGAYGDIELALQNVEWRREVNLSWMEFSRWGIQQIILISRLYYVKNPLIQRGVNVAAHYVFGRGFELSSPDQDANDTLREFQEDNKQVLGQVALVNLEKRLYYDGQIFFVFFPDAESSGKVKIRTIDAAEIQEVYCNPDDSDEPWFYRREWWVKQREGEMGPTNTTTSTRTAWYPALGYEPDDRPSEIGGGPVMWDNPVIHMKSGSGVSKWHFDLPLVYAALNWAKAAKEYLEDCATQARAQSEIARIITTKGGQQALEGIKQQMSTTVGPTNSLWDTNPPNVAGGTMGVGPGTKLDLVNSRGTWNNPEEVRRFIHMVAVVFGIPETFFADASTGSLATAQSLDRPTELRFLEAQERWREALVRIGKFVLGVSLKAQRGRMREAMLARRQEISKVLIMEAMRRISSDGRRMIETWEFRKNAEGKLELWEAARKVKQSEVIVSCSFPSIREGDLPALVKAVAEAMTLDNKGGQIVGIDEKAGVTKLCEILGIENYADLVEEMYPEKEYEVDRTKQVQTDPIGRAHPEPGGELKIDDQGQAAAKANDKQVKEALVRFLEAMRKITERRAA